ncbi:MAG: 30S ribosomal protein S6 [Malacoplasma sp.]|nr:30S ribosomal protein S6 [Mycoplasma sp.]MDE5553101.1 30S ribosomal protein S6 [Malacoplasma sp.]
MAKYEIMVVLDGTLKETEANKTLTDLKGLLKKVKDLEVEKMGLRDLAYPINKKNRGFYFVLTFSTDEPEIIAEFRRVTLLTKDVLRHLIINLEKDYGYKATINPKKVAKSKFRAKRYEKIQAAIELEQEKVRKEKDTSSVKLTDI